MTNTTTPTCDTCTRAVLTKFDCLTSTQLKGAINRQFGILYSVGAISSSLLGHLMRKVSACIG